MPAREIDMLPSRIVGRRREGASTASSADALLRTAQALRGVGLAPRGLFRFASFEEAQQWIRSQMSRRSARRRSTISGGSVEPSTKPGAETRVLDGVPLVLADRETLIRTKQTVRPSDAADRAWLQALGNESAR